MFRTELFQNCTPHAIVIRVDSIDHPIPPSGEVARVETRERVVDTLFGVPVCIRELGLPQIPQREEGKYMIVSSMVLDALKGIPDSDHIFAPDSGATAIRNDKGHIVAVTRLIKVG